MTTLFNISGITVEGLMWSKQVDGDAEGSDAMGELRERVARGLDPKSWEHALAIAFIHDTDDDSNHAFRVDADGELHEIANVIDVNDVEPVR